MADFVEGNGAKGAILHESARGTAETVPTVPNQLSEDDTEMAPTKSIKAPAYQFYPGDFLKDENVLLMSFTEIGVYQVLLCHAWTNRGLPSDIGAIAKMLKLSRSRFEKLWRGPLANCFVRRGDRLVNPRQEAERQKQAEFRRRQSDNGKAGGRPQKSHTKPRENPPLSSGKARALKTEEEDRSVQIVEKGDVAFAAFRDAYPPSRRDGGFMAQQAYLHECVKAGGPQALTDALENHKQSEQWADPSKIPAMLTWLSKERWRQRLEPPSEKPKKWGTWRPSPEVS